MWVVILEIILALGLAVFIVWFTWPKKRNPEENAKPEEKREPEEKRKDGP